MSSSPLRIVTLVGSAVVLACGGYLVFSSTSRDTGAGASRGQRAAAPAAPRPTAWRAAFASADRERIDQALRQVEASGAAGVETLRAFLVDGDRGVREWAAHGLGDLAPQDAGVVQELRRAFEDEDDWVRWKAARALGRIGPPLALPALPALEQAAGAAQETEVVRAASQKAVAILKGQAPRGD